MILINGKLKWRVEIISTDCPSTSIWWTVKIALFHNSMNFRLFEKRTPSYVEIFDTPFKYKL